MSIELARGLQLFEEIGAAPEIEQIRALMKTAGCPARADEDGAA